jgi:hypothetical protein
MEIGRDERAFYLTSTRGLYVLMYKGQVNVIPGQNRLTPRIQYVKYGIPSNLNAYYRDNHGNVYNFRIELDEDGERFIVCHKDHVKIIYRALQEAIRSSFADTTKDVTKPVLPAHINRIIEEGIFDFYQAIEDMGTTKGFGNIGFIFHGPAGTGKSATMRWISDYCEERFGYNSYEISLKELHENLVEGRTLHANRSLIMIDDIDVNVLRDRRETNNPLTSQLLKCLDGLNKYEGRVFIISTNETLGRIDPALLRPGRFDTIVKFEYPSYDLIDFYLTEQGVEISASRFYGWSFARIDMFLSRFKVAQYRFGTTLEAFYEKFITFNGAEDTTVSTYNEYE